MSVTTQDIHQIANLSRLSVKEEDIPKQVAHLNNLLTLIATMQDIDTTNVEPMSHPLENQIQRLREDNVIEKNRRGEFQCLTTHVAEGLYIVPKVIE